MERVQKGKFFSLLNLHYLNTKQKPERAQRHWSNVGLSGRKTILPLSFFPLSQCWRDEIGYRDVFLICISCARINEWIKIKVLY